MQRAWRGGQTADVGGFVAKGKKIGGLTIMCKIGIETVLIFRTHVTNCDPI